MQQKKLQVWIPLLLSISMIAGIFIGYKLSNNFPGKSFFYMEKRRPFQEILDLIEHKYVDSVNVNDLTDTAIHAMLAKLDPHSVFIPANDLEEINESLQGSFFGVGIEFDIFNDTLNVINVIKDGPGYKAGIQERDQFIRANGKNIAGMKLQSDSLRNLLRGNRGSALRIDLIRKGKMIQLPIMRDLVPLSSIDASYMINREIGFIKINKFSIQTYREFMISLDSLKKQGLKKLILDLRDNGGGVMDQAVEIADEFLSGDKLITYTEGKHMPKKEYRCRRTGQFESGMLVVLSDEGSASASEIIMGALQDWDRATIIGRRSFGKGLVQEQFDLSDQSALRLTIARYYTPLGRSIQRPYSNGQKAYFDEIDNRNIYQNDSAVFTDVGDTTKIFKTNSGKKLLGAGGIAPDLYVGMDSGLFSNALVKLFRKGTISHFAYFYTNEHPEIFTSFNTPAQFIQAFHFGKTDWDFLNAIATKDSIPTNEIQKINRIFLESTLKSAIARQIWKNNGYFEALNAEDKVIKKALEIMK